MFNSITMFMKQKIDKNGKPYYTLATEAPCMVDLSSAIIMGFPVTLDNGQKGQKLMFKFYDPDFKSRRLDGDKEAQASLASKGEIEDIEDIDAISSDE